MMYVYMKSHHISHCQVYTIVKQGEAISSLLIISQQWCSTLYFISDFFKNILKWSVYYAWKMSSEFDKEARINVKNDWRRSWKTITPAFYFHRICMSSLQRHQRRELFTQFWRRWKNLTHHVSSSAWSPSIELSADADT